MFSVMDRPDPEKEPFASAAARLRAQGAETVIWSQAYDEYSDSYTVLMTGWRQGHAAPAVIDIGWYVSNAFAEAA
jgi:hypothetical protein